MQRPMTHWYQTTAYDKRASLLYDRHYSRAILNKSSVGKRQFTIANSLVLVTVDYSALWVTCWQNPVARNDGKDMWCNQIFRNESDISSSVLISEAVQISRWRWWPLLPPDGFTTYVADRLVQSDIAGYCYRRATPRWHKRGFTLAKKLSILHISTKVLQTITPIMPLQFQLSLFDMANI